MAELTRDCDQHQQSDPVPHVLLLNHGRIAAAELGKHRPAFPGTDALAFNIQPKAVEWLKTRLQAEADHPMPYSLILGEGQRLGNQSFMNTITCAGATFHLVYLNAAAPLLMDRCAHRGSTQNTSWAKGAATQAFTLAQAAAEAGHDVIHLDARMKPAKLAEELFTQIPALEALR
jgi:P-loop Nucleotide Kinase3